MKKIKALLFSFGLAGLLLGAAACGSDPVKDMEGIANEMCACKDAACIKGIEEKLNKLGEKYKDTKDISADDQKKLMGLAMKAAECGQKIMQAEGGAGGEEKPAEPATK